MSKVGEKFHWMADVLKYFEIQSANLPFGTPADVAWARAESAGKLTSAELTQKIAAHFRLGIADLDAADSAALKLIPEKLARRYVIFPLWQDDRSIYVATCDPTNYEAEQAIAFSSGRRAVLRIASPQVILDAIRTKYSPEKMVEGLLAAVDADLNNAVRVLDVTEQESVGIGDIEAAPVIRLTNLILRDAVRDGASDIHIEPAQGGGTVRFRVDGVLRSYIQIPMAALNRVVTRLKVLGKIDISDRLRPHDGRARVRIDQKTYDLRMSTVPTRDAEKAVIRILDPESARTIDDMGLARTDVRRFRTLLSNREGIILVTGPTGSGKTTTLYAALSELATGKVNITTVEDPIEYELAGLTQIQVEPRRGVTFASSLSAILRQDPDVIFVGEIRDIETATMAVQASMTGHLVLSTLHTNDAVGAVSRLVDIGLDRASIASTLRGVVAQRLIRKVCAECGSRGPGELTVEQHRLAARYGMQPVANARGCEACKQVGYRGRIPLQEILIVGPQLQDAISSGATAAELHRLGLAGGMRTIRAAGIARAVAGETTLEELDRVLGDVAEDHAAPPEAPTQPHVLIVDDDPINRRIQRSLLEKQGYRVSEASDGFAALEKVSSDPAISLMVMDLTMPRLGGREVLAKLKASPATQAIPVIVLTSAADESTESQLMEEGADDYIRKPLEPLRFVARVKAVLRRQSA